VAIHGIGGLGHLALQYCGPPRLPYRRPVSGAADRSDLARELGAHTYVDTDATERRRGAAGAGGARVILCTAPSVEAIAGLINGLGIERAS